MQTLRRTIHPEVRIDDSRKGIVTYIASNETPDSYREVIRADGWRFTNFSKNAPFVDSHDYSTLSKQVGKIISFKVSGGSLIETVQWAIDVAENELAQLGWKMTLAGYLKAVSVGFWPVEYVTPGQTGWDEQLAELKLDASAGIRTIYTQQEQVELSSCIIGANPDALACAYRDGVLRDSHLSALPDLRRAFEANNRRVRSFSFSQPQTRTHRTAMSQESFLEKFRSLTGLGSSRQAAAPDFDTARAGNSPAEFHLALRSAVARQRDFGVHEACGIILGDPEKLKFWNDAARFYRESAELRRMGGHKPKFRNIDLTPGDFGVTDLLPPGIVDDIWDLLPTFGTFSTLGVRPAGTQYTKLAQITALPQTMWIMPNQSSPAVTPDTTANAKSYTQPMNVLASMIPVFIGLVDDKTDFGTFLFEQFVKALYSGLDYACFQGNGVTDATNGGQTGIFNDATIGTVQAGVGSTSVQLISRADIEALVAKVAPAVLQRDPQFWINPAFLPALAKAKDGQGDTYLLRGPGNSPNGKWMLCDWPVNWTAQAPAVDATPGAKVIAFGQGDAYAVSLRQDVAIGSSRFIPTGWSNWQYFYMAYLRAWCQTREATGLATLALAKQ